MGDKNLRGFSPLCLQKFGNKIDVGSNWTWIQNSLKSPVAGLCLNNTAMRISYLMEQVFVINKWAQGQPLDLDGFCTQLLYMGGIVYVLKSTPKWHTSNWLSHLLFIYLILNLMVKGRFEFKFTYAFCQYIEIQVLKNAHKFVVLFLVIKCWKSNFIATILKICDSRGSNFYHITKSTEDKAIKVYIFLQEKTQGKLLMLL